MPVQSCDWIHSSAAKRRCAASSYGMRPSSEMRRMPRSISFLLEMDTQLIQLPATRPIAAIVPVERLLNVSFTARCFHTSSGDGSAGATAKRRVSPKRAACARAADSNAASGFPARTITAADGPPTYRLGVSSRPIGYFIRKRRPIFGGLPSRRTGMPGAA